MTVPDTLIATPLPEGRKPRRDDEFLCTIDSIDARGMGIGRWGEYRVRIAHVAPGATVLAQVVKRRRDRLDSRVLELREVSPDAVEPRCSHFGSCGGCSFQGIGYDRQLELMHELSCRELAPILGRAGEALVQPVLGCASPWNYRNKMDFTYSNKRWVEEGEPEGIDQSFALGMHSRGRYDKVLDVKNCDIQFEAGNPILATASRLAREQELSGWDTKEHEGVLRHLVLRHGVHTNDIMVYLVTSREGDDVARYAQAILSEHPEITTFIHGVNDGLASVATSATETVLHGPGVIHERMGELDFEISSTSFFQTNTLQAERLMEVIEAEAKVGSDDVLLDLYCGAGVIGLMLAKSVREVIGLEREASSIKDAIQNAQRNGISNARFVAGEVESIWSAESDLPKPDVCIVDPPRAGLHPKVIVTLVELAPPRLIYVSCNLAAAARDLVPLIESGYELINVQPVDLFPHTPHIEGVLTLIKHIA
ncbi:MAG: 23S rRNA (uracil1939-C5)-methyltransferase [Planctomycetota bacterium]|jgi:23S rRNA (uracil1939-C5)-methyltransferase